MPFERSLQKIYDLNCKLEAMSIEELDLFHAIREAYESIMTDCSSLNLMRNRQISYALIAAIISVFRKLVIKRYSVI